VNAALEMANAHFPQDHIYRFSFIFPRAIGLLRTTSTSIIRLF